MGWKKGQKRSEETKHKISESVRKYHAEHPEVYDKISKGVNAWYSEHPEIRKMKSDYLFNLLISIIVDSYYEVIEHMQDYLMDMEDLLMEFNADHKDSGKQIQLFRRDYSRLKKAKIIKKTSMSKIIRQGILLVLDKIDKENNAVVIEKTAQAGRREFD